ncbi:MAG: glucose 1-dehydrogenase [Alphaproteobacteria bacterium]|nr:glucose 1-dehydrogenase [Alphaproteobacteria bacterium]
MAGKLQGRVALVTGGARGIGAASAAALAAEGAAVLVTDVLDADGEATAAAIASKGARAGYMRHDVRDEAAWQAAVAEAERRFGGLDILLNNAGIFALKPMSMTTIEEFRHMQAINIEGVFLGMKTASPAIGKRGGQWGGGGSIINLSSVAGLTGAAFAVPYNASKGAVRLMTKGAALEFAQLGLKIRVNSIHPGIIDTMMGQKVMDELVATGAGSANEVRSNAINLHPLGRLGVAADIANAVVFLASDDAAFMTGSEVVVDGGLTAR